MRKRYAVGLFVDLKKVLDTANHDILIRNMEKYGFRGIVLNWLKSYILNRQQFVQINQDKSRLMNTSKVSSRAKNVYYVY